MSYDVVLQRFRDGEPEPVEEPQVWRLLEEAWQEPPDEFDFCRVRRGEDEGDLYAVQPRAPVDSLMFNHAEPRIYELMYDLAAAGGMAIILPDVGPFLVREEQRKHLPPELRRRASVVSSGAELVRAIERA